MANQPSWKTWLQQKAEVTFTLDNKLEALWVQDEIKPAITWLEHEDILTISGKDAVKFLQGQSTCHVEQLADTTAALGACCTPKGRMIANFRLIKANNELLYLTLPTGQAENLQTGLGKYAVFYQVSFNDQKQWIRIGVYAGSASIDHLLADLVAGFPTDQLFTVVTGKQQGEIWVDETAIIQLVERLISQYSLISTDLWKLNELKQGIAWVLPSQTEKMLPQECNWELVDGVNFKKGCYTGQEIVARLHYRGQSKKRLQYFILEQKADEKEIINQKIVDAENKACGFVVNAVRNPQSQQTHLLANVRLDQSDQPLFLENDTKQPLQHEPLPYPVS